MTSNIEFSRGVISPVECLKEGWALVKSQYWLFLGICVAGMLIGSAFAIVLMGPMMCGIYFCFFQHIRGERVTFDGLFKGFDYFAQSVIATLIQSIPAVLIIIPVYLIMGIGMLISMQSSRGSNPDEVAGVAFLTALSMGIVIFFLILLLSIVLGIFFMFTFPLIVDRKLSGVEAVKLSIKAGLANFGGVFGLVLLNALLSFGGLLLCYVGAIFVLPITIAAQVVAHRRVFPDIGLSNTPTPPPPPGSWTA